jgi:hypothetical protein
MLKILADTGQHAFACSFRFDKYRQIIGVADKFVPSGFQFFIKIIQLSPYEIVPMPGTHKSFEYAPSGPHALTRAAQIKR